MAGPGWEHESSRSCRRRPGRSAERLGHPLRSRSLGSARLKSLTLEKSVPAMRSGSLRCLPERLSRDGSKEAVKNFSEACCPLHTMRCGMPPAQVVAATNQLLEHAQQTPFAQEDHVVQALHANRAHKPFCVGVGVRRLDGVRTMSTLTPSRKLRNSPFLPPRVNSGIRPSTVALPGPWRPHWNSASSPRFALAGP